MNEFRILTFKVFNSNRPTRKAFILEKLTYFVFAPSADFEYNAATFQLYSLKPLKVENPY
jgi:hypothetical protein